jgi:hypothetical protein
LIKGFPSWKDALKFEWRWKRMKRKHKSWERGLEELMKLDKPTKSATPFKDYKLEVCKE